LYKSNAFFNPDQQYRCCEGTYAIYGYMLSVLCRIMVKIVFVCCDGYVELLNQKTEEIERLMNEKKVLVADILQIPLHDYDTIAEVRTCVDVDVHVLSPPAFLDKYN